ncbi:hypothetical protein ACS0TY_018752 [Phlomoides rotata]
MENFRSRNSTSFFFQNFPTDCKMESLRFYFNKVGMVVDLFIPQKRGKPFGFVRFENDGDEEKLLEDLNNVWIGSYKIRAFFPRYGRKSPEVNTAKQPETRPFEANRNARKPSTSYACD